MNRQELWIREGRIITPPTQRDGTVAAKRTLLDQQSMVRISFNDTGTVVEWVPSRPNWASLMVSQSLITAMIAPYTLKFFNAGWFTETYASAAEAIQRIETLISHSDVRLSDRAYITEQVPDIARLTETVRSALEQGTAPDSQSIICQLDPDREFAQVEHVGEQSLIGSLWGVQPNSFPFVTGNNFDRAVTPFYFKAMRTGKPHHDHVLASMVLPDGERHWLGYHRAILPEFHGRQKRVRVVSASAPVAIQLL
jgi:hypothetical protein